MRHFNVIDLFDRLWNNPISPSSDFFREAKESFNELYSTNFPPLNIWVDKESRELVFEIALAGYTKDDIILNFEDDKMILELKKKDQTNDDSRLLMYQGLKYSCKKAIYWIPRSKYDHSKAEAEFNDGILKIKIPSIKPEKTNVPIMIK